MLMRSGRANALPLGHPLQSALIPRYVMPRVRRAVDRLPPGTLVPSEIPGAARLRAPPNAVLRDTGALLRRRFAERVVARTPTGLVLVRLEPRRGASR